MTDERLVAPYIIIPDEVLYNPNISVLARVLFGELLRLKNSETEESNIAFDSSKLAEMYGVHQEEITLAARELAEASYITNLEERNGE